MKKVNNPSHKDGRLPELTPTMLPSIQNAVEHFRKTMKRMNESCVHLPPLYQSCDVGDLLRCVLEFCR
jgi:hypothetical protein